MSFSAFAPPSIPCTLAIPIDDVEQGDDRRYRIQIDGKPHVVVYHVELDCWFLLEPPSSTQKGYRLGAPVWRTGPGQWQIGSRETFSQRPRLSPQAAQPITLPALPSISPQARALPRVIHYVWIGEAGIPDALVQTMFNNAHRCNGYAIWLHAHTKTPLGWQRLQAQFPAQSDIRLIDLSKEPHFDTFQQSTLGKFYHYFIDETHRNYGAAADILRVYLLHRHGGIYMDVDDYISHSLADNVTLLAGPDDVLLNRMLDVAEFQFQGYANSNFAAHAGNRVLAEMLQEMERRLNASGSFFSKPRPWRRATASEGDQWALTHDEAMLAYVLTIFRLTGPHLFNDMIRSLRPDYYGVEGALLQAYKTLNLSPSEPSIIADDYLDQMHAAKNFYLPFMTPAFDVTIGRAYSWNPVRLASGEPTPSGTA